MEDIINKSWNELTTKQKQKRFYRITVLRCLFFWGVCGKDRQHYYQQLEITDENADLVREQMYNEYMAGLKTQYFYDYHKKVEEINRLLRKGKYEKQ